MVRNKLVLFCTQILLLIIFVVIFNYEFQIEFDLSSDPRASEQQIIIQFLANLVMYENSIGFVYIYITWILASFIPILIFKDFKKAYSMNLTTFFFPNFFFYVFYWRYSETYFTALFPNFIIRTIILGMTIIIVSIAFSLIFKIIISFRKSTKTDNLEQIESLNKIQCPKCGTQFNSIPKYCFNCNSLLTNDLGENIGKPK
ncbi:MAG: hypothetical protein ACFE8G_00995 [Candidatus Hermodarchaeota archaeon]